MSAIFYFDNFQEKPNAFFNDMHFKIDALSKTEKEEFEERAAIMEFEGQLSHEEAEWRALRIILENRIKIAV